MVFLRAKMFYHKFDGVSTMLGRRWQSLGRCVVVAMVLLAGCGGGKSVVVTSVVAKDPVVGAHNVFGKRPQTVCSYVRTHIGKVSDTVAQAHPDGGGRSALRRASLEIATLLQDGSASVRSAAPPLRKKNITRVIARMRSEAADFSTFASELASGGRRSSTANFVVFLSMTVNPVGTC